VPSPIITLTTDFGLRDPFVGIMKGVILGICQEARLVDLTHEIAPHDVLEGALALESAVAFFPEGSVHVAVVDPGVGSPRRALAIASAGHYFVGPDNGLLTAALRPGRWSAVSLEAAAYRLAPVSGTFHGRDIFAPAAAHLGCGVPLERLGPPVTDPVTLALPGCRAEGAGLVGEVIGVDRFGNLITSVTADRLGALDGGSLSVEVAGQDVGPLVGCYADAVEGMPRPIIGSGGRLEIFVRNGSARERLGATRGTAIRVTRRGS